MCVLECMCVLGCARLQGGAFGRPLERLFLFLSKTCSLRKLNWRDLGKERNHSSLNLKPGIGVGEREWVISGEQG